MKVKLRIDLFDGSVRRMCALDVNLDAVPRQGEWVETCPEWSAETVRAVSWLPLENAVLVVLDDADTSNDDDPEAYEAALRSAGWSVG